MAGGGGGHDLNLSLPHRRTKKTQKPKRPRLHACVSMCYGGSGDRCHGFSMSFPVARRRSRTFTPGAHLPRGYCTSKGGSWLVATSPGSPVDVRRSTRSKDHHTSVRRITTTVAASGGGARVGSRGRVCLRGVPAQRGEPLLVKVGSERARRTRALDWRQKAPLSAEFRQTFKGLE